MARTKKKASDLIDKQLARYREMRDFAATAEPRGDEDADGKRSLPVRESGKSQFPFVVQKHSATRLHYDFRLGLHGTLKSWAVTKGPSYVTADKRLAVEVEDHPMEYGGFEGTIPKGQYGGGTVMLWDEGTWEPVGDPDEGLKKGNLKFILHGKKLKGKWVLVRMGGRAARADKPNWLLIKEHDEYERKPDDPSILEEKPDSVVSGRNLDAIARDQDHVWESNHPETHETKDFPAKEFDPGDLPGPKEKLPEFLSPQLAKQALKVPGDKEWFHELKLDGYRIQAHLQRSGSRTSVKLFSRNGLDWTHRMPKVAKEIARLGVEDAILDGELVVLDEAGRTSFANLQAAFEENKPQALTYFVFDLLHLNGHNLRGLALSERKQILSALLKTRDGNETVRFGDHLEADGEKMFAQACKMGAEGVVSKRASSLYTSGRSSSWIKVKCIRQQEFVIGGFTLPSDRSHGIGALLLGYYEQGKLRYAGRTGTGFTRTTSRSLRDRLAKLKADKCPFEAVPTEARRGAIWVQPATVAQVQFGTWTADKRVRQASFKGIREDKPAPEVHREEPDPVLEAETKSGPKKKSSKSSHSNSSVSHPSQSTRRMGHSGSSSSDSSSHRSQSAPRIENPKSRHSATASTTNIRVTHPEKVIDPETKLTKQDLVDYYLAIADAMLPHIAGRPLSLVRCPDGAGEHCFFQKHLGQGMPDGVDGVEIPNKDGKGSETYVTVSTAEGLAGLAQMNVLEVHAWGSTNADLEHPDRIVFDLDPDEAVSWRTLSDAAADVRERLGTLGLKSFLKTTGGKGLHVVAPVRAEYDWNQVKPFTHAFTLQMEKDNPKLYISKMSKAARKNKIFVDYMRNERGATAIAPYSSRARLGMGVALPLPWTELESSSRPHFPVIEFAEWKSRVRMDPWKEMMKIDQRIPENLFQG